MPALVAREDDWTPERIKQHRQWRAKMYAPVKAKLEESPKPEVRVVETMPLRLSQIILTGAVLGRLQGADIPASISQNISLREIQSAVCFAFGVTRTNLLSKRRTREIVRLRQIAFFLCCEFTRRSLPEIGRAFDGMDHTTVMHGRDRVKPIYDSIKDKTSGKSLVEVARLIANAWWGREV